MKKIHNKGITIKKIVSNYYNVSLDNNCRKREFCQPRQIAQYLCHKHTTLSNLEIGQLFNITRHPVIYGCNKIKHLIYNRPEITQQVIEIESILEKNENNAI